MTIRDLPPGCKFKLFTRYRDGQRRPRLVWGGDKGARITRAYLRVNGHALNGAVVEITRVPCDLRDELVVIQHRSRECTIVADTYGRTAPVWSGMRLQVRDNEGRPVRDNARR